MTRICGNIPSKRKENDLVVCPTHRSLQLRHIKWYIQLSLYSIAIYYSYVSANFLLPFCL